MSIIDRLGFGCAYLTGGFELRSNLRLVDVAYDEGIRHFDVAPLYGLGTAEAVLGKALKGKRSDVTIATKVGRPRPSLTLKTQVVRLLAKPVRMFAASYLRRREVAMSKTRRSESNFDIGFVERSLNESLGYLQTDYVDVFLLHEVSAGDLTDELMRFLEESKRSGKVKSYGIASRFENIMSIESAFPDYRFDVVQYSWSVLDNAQPRLFTESRHITHRAIARSHAPLLSWFRGQPNFVSELSKDVGVDLRDEQNLIALLVLASLSRDASDMTLFSTRSASRLSSNIERFQRPGFDEAAVKFLGELRSRADLPAPLA